MKGFQIAQLLSKFGEEVYKSLLGIVAINELPETIPEYNYVVSNLSTNKHSAGSHWIVRKFYHLPKSINVLFQ